jgi:hypothetical protein
MSEPMTYIEVAIEFTEMVSLALSRPDVAAALEQLRANTQQGSQRLILRSRTELTKPERIAVQNFQVVLQDHLRTIEKLQRAGQGAADVWHNTLKHYRVADADGAPVQVAAEVGGVSHRVDVESVAMLGSSISTVYEVLIRNRLTAENTIKYFQAKAEGKIFVSRGPAGSGKTSHQWYVNSCSQTPCIFTIARPQGKLHTGWCTNDFSTGG